MSLLLRILARPLRPCKWKKGVNPAAPAPGPGRPCLPGPRGSLAGHERARHERAPHNDVLQVWDPWARRGERRRLTWDDYDRELAVGRLVPTPMADPTLDWSQKNERD